MTKAPTPKSDFDVGYGKPPQHSRFPKGQSGNPGGAPKKKKVENNMILSARYPTRSILRDEGARTVTIREGQERKEVTVTQAIMMALEQTALKGGVLAQRTYLEMQFKEDEVYITERREKFERWREIKAESEAEVASAKKSGRDIREIVPHPDDIILNYVTYEVSILGAVNALDRQEELRQARLRDLFYELSIYYDEGNVKVEGDDKATMIGLFMTSYICTENNLPPSLRRSLEDINTDVWDKVLLSRRTWSDDLEARCQEFDLPFFYTPLGKSRKFAFPLKDLGFGWRNGGLEPVRPDVIRKRNRMLKALNR